VTGDELLDALIETLEQLVAIVPSDKVVWDAEPMRRLAVERLWITAGNVAETYRRDVLDVDPGVGPWSELVAYRNKLAHALPGDLSTDRIYADSRAEPARLLALVRDQRL
jgi:uncharacterized protein with HEPN domain